MVSDDAVDSTGIESHANLNSSSSKLGGEYSDDDAEDDGPVCHICLDGNCYDNNEIIFCDNCDVAVHQSCYGVADIPEGSWYCYVCSSGGHPNQTVCVLCSNKGGAYKPTNIPGVWAHGLCGTWIPEIFATDHTGRTLNITYLDKKREKLRCQLCSSKGVCVQCAYGRCTNAVHPWCCMQPSSGFTHRIIKNERSETCWEIFCKTHASAVSEPVKPKVKAKNQPISRPIDEVESDDDYFGVNSLSTSVKASKIVDSSSDDDIDSEFTRRKGKGKAPSEISSGQNVLSIGKGSQFLNLSEWPGLSESEGLDLDHFWNFTSSCFLEDNSKEWFTAMTKDLLERFQNDAQNLEELTRFPPINALILDEGKQISFTSEKDRIAAIDLEKRANFLSSVYRDIHRLTSSQDQPTGPTENGLVYLRGSADVLDDEDLFLTKEIQNSTIRNTNKHDPYLNVIFDGSVRYACNFNLEQNNEILGTPMDDDFIKLAKQSLLGSDVNSNFPSKPSDGCSYSLLLSKYTAFSDEKEVPLFNNKTIIAKNDDDVVSRMLRSDQIAYSHLMQTLQSTLTSLHTSNKLTTIGQSIKLREQFSVVENLYLKQRIWRKIAKNFYCGVRDHGEGFNRVEIENVPASWKLKVEGREAPPDGEEDEVIEDAICMCCFDGSSTDSNKILFCDGCNASMHQACYGVAEIPEGDFYCERCKEVQYTARSQGRSFTRHDAPHLVMCSLCPVQHGGIKGTTDGRWVHVCCAIWSNSVFKDLSEMSPIDISTVQIQKPYGRNDLSRGSVFDQPCKICNVHGGYLTQCKHNSGTQCSAVFHPLCAWFEGYYTSTSITDPTFEGRDRHGLFPSGLSFEFYCMSHSPKAAEDQSSNKTLIEARRSQMTLRRKYMMKLSDLECIPGIVKNKRSKCKQKKSDQDYESGGGGGRSARPTQNQEKEIPIDIYDNKICAICISATEPLSECEAWSKFTAFDAVTPLQPENNPDFFNICHEIKPLPKIEINEETTISKASTANDLPEEHTEPLSNTAEVTRTVIVEPNQTEITTTKSTSNHATLSMSCSTCGITVHTSCLQSLTEIRLPSQITKPWQCNNCHQGNKDIACAFCPRRGGFFLATSDGTWSHVYCARFTTCQVKVSKSREDDGNSSDHIKSAYIDIRNIPKDRKSKSKCVFCNRKTGVCERCSVPGCSVQFHPLCAERSGRGFIHARLGVNEYYCSDHIPEGVERVSYRSVTKSGVPFLTRHWVNGSEMQRLRYVLGRSMTVLDSLTRREKYKRLLSKADGEYFSLKLQRLLDRAKGRKSDGLSGVDVGDIFDDTSSEESMEYDGDDVEYSSVIGDADILKPLKNKRQTRKKTDQIDNIDPVDDWISGVLPREGGIELKITVDDDQEEEFIIGPHWNNGNDVILPNRLFIGIGGYEIDKRETLIEGGSKAFLRIFKERMITAAEKTREACGIFSTSQQAAEFNRKLGPLVLKRLALSNDEFKALSVKEGFPFEYPKEPAVSKPLEGKNRRKNSIEVIDDLLDQEEPIAKSRGRQKKVDSYEPVENSRKRKVIVLEDEENEMQNTTKIKKSRISEPVETVHNPLPEPQPVFDYLTMPQNAIITNTAARATAIAAAGPYLAPQQLQNTMASDALTHPIAQTLQGGNTRIFGTSEPMEDIYAMGGIVLDSQNDSDEWRVFDASSLPQLERRLQDILNAIDLYQIPDDSASALESQTSSARSRNRHRGRRRRGVASDGEKTSIPTRYLCEDFAEIPDESFPEYNNFVRHVITLDVLKVQLQRHMFSSMAAFSKSFYEMLNNGKAVTPINSRTWTDAKMLAEVFEELKASTLNPTTYSSPQALRYSLQNSSKSKEETILQCCDCSQKYCFENWPNKFRVGAYEEDGWRWLCKDCLALRGSSILQTRVQVWWHDDKVAYAGSLKSVDSITNRFCVLYDDGQWEFIDLSYEPVIYFPDENIWTPATRDVDDNTQSRDESHRDKKKRKVSL